MPEGLAADAESRANRITRAVGLWRERKLDTFDIARRVGLEEHEVCAAIHADREGRRR